MKGIILLLIKFYRKFISPLYPQTCRYYPSCSEYSFQAIERFGIIKGIFMSFYRILRCNPFSKGGYDPVPDK